MQQEDAHEFMLALMGRISTEISGNKCGKRCEHSTEWH